MTIDFDLSDPFFTEYKPGEYKPLHDPHLKHFLNKKSVRRCLMKNNLVTKDGEVRCTLQEFNRFQRNLKHYFKTQKRIASALEKKKFYVDPRKVLRRRVKNAMLQKRIQHNIKIAEAKARRTESTMKRRKQILDNIVLKQKHMAQVIERTRLEREKAAGQFQMERKMRELIKIRLDSSELIRRGSILHKIRQKERIVAQKQLLKRQRRLKEITNQNLVWHKERMEAKDEEMIKFLDENNEKQARRKRSIATRKCHSELHKTTVNEQQKRVFENHVRIEDTHLDEAKAWEKKVERNRMKAARKWRAKMHCMQTIAEGRMADIERRKYDRKRNAAARQAAKIEESLDVLENMDVTVLGTTGCGSPELANIHRDNSRIRFSAYYDPGRDMIDPCRTTKFHAHFKPFHVVHAKYQPGYVPRPPPPKDNSVQISQIHHVPISGKASKASSSLSKSTCGSTSSLSNILVDDLLAELMVSELRGVISECQEEMESEIVVDGLIETILKDVVDGEVVRASKQIVGGAINLALERVSKQPSSENQKPIKITSNFTLSSDNNSTVWSEITGTTSCLDVQDLIGDVVRKIMKCFEGGHEEVYAGQTSTTDCRTKDGEEIITEIITRLVATVQNFTRCTQTPASESCESILTSESSSRESLKDLHKRAQFLLNHALDIAQVKLKLSGYSYLTWNIMEDCLKKGRDSLLAEKPAMITQLTDVEIVEWIMEEAKKFLQSATTLMYDMMHGCGKKLDDEMEQRYLEQLEKTDQNYHPDSISDDLLEEVAAEGDVAKFAVLLVKKTLHNAALSIPRKSSIVLSEALHDGNYEIAGSILAETSITVAHKEIELDPQQPTKMRFKEALRNGDIVTAGTLLANRTLQQAMNINLGDFESDPMEDSISAMILEVALDQGDLDTAGGIIIGSSLREAINYINTPTPEISLEKALQYGDLEVAGTILIDEALQRGLKQMYEEDSQVRRDSSIALESALCVGNIPKAGDIIVSRLLKSGMSGIVDKVDEELVEQVINGTSTMVIGFSKSDASDVVPMSSSEILNDALLSGNLEAAAPVLANRAVRSVQNGQIGGKEENTEFENVIPMTSSEILNDALNTGNLEEAAPVLANRALRSAMSDEVEATPDEEDGEVVIPAGSSLVLKNALAEGNLEEAAPVLANRALRSALSKEDEESKHDLEEDGQDDSWVFEQLENEKCDGPVAPANSYEELKIVKTSSSLGEDVTPTFSDGIYYLEASKKTSLNEDMYDRGLAYVTNVLNDVTNQFETLFENDIRNKYEILKPSLLKSDYDEAAMILVKSFLDTVRSFSVTAVKSDPERESTKFATLMTRLVFQKCLEIIRGGSGLNMSNICEYINEHIRKTLCSVNISAGSEAIVSMVIGKCLKHVINSTDKEVRSRSSIELFEACREGDTASAGAILTQKVLKEAENKTQVDVSTFKSTDEILSEKQDDSRSTQSSTSIRSTKSKKKINTEGLPMPKPLSAGKSRSDASNSNNFGSVREMLMSEEREYIVNKMVSESERSIAKQQSSKHLSSSKSDKALSRKDSIATSVQRLAEFCDKQLKENPREVGEEFARKQSDESLPTLTEGSSSESLGYVRKIQSKGHIYYINEDGVIKKRTRRKRSSKKRLPQDDLKVNASQELDSEDKDEVDESSGEPQAVSSESSLLNTSSSGEVSPICSKKSLEQRRSSIKKKDSSLQVLAVINSSYSNMIGKKGSNEVAGNRESDTRQGANTSRSRLNIDEMLSETDKELIQKLSNASAKEKESH
ncbi:hypothetical protein ACHWQZ_G004300 [Mnemiopsis leidyi]